MNTENRTVIFYITENGSILAQKIAVLYPNAKVFKFRKELVINNWKKFRCHIFVMATGIVVRTIADLIEDKKIDPAVVVIDESGRFVISLLSGHFGGANEIAREIADFLDGEAVITTASDVNKLPSIDLWARENNLVIDDWDILPHFSTDFINKEIIKVYSEIPVEIPEEFLVVDDVNDAKLLITNKNNISTKTKEKLYLRPKNLVVGIGCNSGTYASEIESAVRRVLDENNLAFSSVRSIATIDRKAKEPGLIAFARKYDLAVDTFSPKQLNTVDGIEGSEIVFKYTSAKAVSEPAAILASEAESLLVSKQKSRNVTVAVAEKRLKNKKMKITLEKTYNTQHGRNQKSSISIVGIGPGNAEHITPCVQKAIREADVIIGYKTYLKLVREIIRDKEVVSYGMTQEVDRCRKVLEISAQGKKVAIISGGDPGIYAMAGLMLEVAKENTNSSMPQIKIIPGISAFNACAAKLGAPLMHDFACISLSDRLTSWKVIEKRLEAASMADFVIVLYNPRSKSRTEHIKKARELILKERHPETPVGIVRAAMREDEKIIITNLQNMLENEIDMQTTVIIGNSRTFVFDDYIVTPRGYSIDD